MFGAAEPALIVLLAYLLGSVPSAYIVGKAVSGVDIREVGSRNAGAANVFIQIGRSAGILVLVADAAKGFVAVLAGLALGDAPWGPFYAAVTVVAGHNWPLFLGFRGGKGVATVLGVSFAVLPWLTLIALIASFLVLLISRNVVLAAAGGFALLNVFAPLSGQSWPDGLMCLVLTAMVMATYLGRSWSQTVASIRARRPLELFSFE